jgi:hypothetical protein
MVGVFVISRGFFYASVILESEGFEDLRSFNSEAKRPRSSALCAKDDVSGSTCGIFKKPSSKI